MNSLPETVFLYDTKILERDNGGVFFISTKSYFRCQVEEISPNWAWQSDRTTADFLTYYSLPYIWSYPQPTSESETEGSVEEQRREIVVGATQTY